MFLLFRNFVNAFLRIRLTCWIILSGVLEVIVQLVGQEAIGCREDELGAGVCGLLER